MKPVVVDASVAAKWFITESDSTQAMKYLNGRFRLIAPDLIHAEIANVFWKLHVRRILNHDETMALAKDFLSLPLEIYDTPSILGPALEIAIATQRTIYDSLYLALAIDVNGIVVTADTRWVNALSGSPFAEYMRLLG